VTVPLAATVVVVLLGLSVGVFGWLAAVDRNWLAFGLCLFAGAVLVERVAGVMT
jgi:hypothetical protein